MEIHSKENSEKIKGKGLEPCILHQHKNYLSEVGIIIRDLAMDISSNSNSQNKVFIVIMKETLKITNLMDRGP